MSPNTLKATKNFVEGQEALLLEVDLSNYLIDYYIHFKENDLHPTKEQDEKLKQFIAALAIHLSLKTIDETVAWTLHLHGEKPYSLFATGNVKQKYIIGHVLSENIRHTDVNILHSQVVTSKGQATRSTIQCETSSIKDVIETYYSQSEQRPLKVHYSDNSDIVTAITTMPGCDQEWLKKVSREDINKLPKKELGSLEFAFSCDCSAEKLMPYFNTLSKVQLEELYGKETFLTINCPRCGRSFQVTKDEALNKT